MMGKKWGGRQTQKSIVTNEGPHTEIPNWCLMTSDQHNAVLFAFRHLHNSWTLLHGSKMIIPVPLRLDVMMSVVNTDIQILFQFDTSWTKWPISAKVGCKHNLNLTEGCLICDLAEGSVRKGQAERGRCWMSLQFVALGKQESNKGIQHLLTL